MGSREDENIESRGVKISLLGFEALPAELQSVCVWPPSPSRQDQSLEEQDH